jgi:hypothetical protein
MNDADCVASHAWARNPTFLAVLAGPDLGCAPGAGDVTESFEVSLGTAHVARKTSNCANPTLDAERACFQALADRLVPP